jgi:hypothetical protein
MLLNLDELKEKFGNGMTIEQAAALLVEKDNAQPFFDLAEQTVKAAAIAAQHSESYECGDRVVKVAFTKESEKHTFNQKKALEFLAEMGEDTSKDGEYYNSSSSPAGAKVSVVKKTEEVKSKKASKKDGE